MPDQARRSRATYPLHRGEDGHAGEGHPASRQQVGAVWAALEKIAPRTQLAAAAAQVEEPEQTKPANIVEGAQGRPIIEVARARPWCAPPRCHSPSITSRTNASNASVRPLGHLSQDQSLAPTAERILLNPRVRPSTVKTAPIDAPMAPATLSTMRRCDDATKKAARQTDRPPVGSATALHAGHRVTHLSSVDDPAGGR